MTKNNTDTKSIKDFEKDRDVTMPEDEVKNQLKALLSVPAGEGGGRC